MTLPSITSEIGESRPTTSLPGSSGTAFIVGEADRGPVDTPVLVRSLAEYVTNFGPRVAYGTLYDTLDVAFHEGLDHAYVTRTVGPAAASATKKLVSGESDTLTVTATSPGEWGNSISVEVVAGAAEGAFKLKVSYGGTLKESSPDLADNTAAVAWAATSAYIRLTDLAAGDPDTEQSIELAAGADDRNNISTAVIEASLALFTPDLGEGQVAVPGNTAEAVQEALIAHCLTTLRVPIIDPEDSAEAEAYIEAAGSLRSADGAKQGAMFGPWDVAPGLTGGTTRTVPPCARQLGAMARVDGETGNPNLAAAGDRGKARYVIGLSQTFSDADREALNDAGVNVSIVDEGVPTTYGWRTLADPVNESGWLPLSTSRLMLCGLAAGARRVLKHYLFAQLDAQGEVVAKATDEIVNEVVKPFYDSRALYGLTLEEACAVVVEQETDPTDGSIANLKATLVARPSKFAETVELVVVETNEAL